MDKNLLKRAVRADVDPTPGYILKELVNLSFVSMDLCIEMQTFFLKVLEQRHGKYDPHVKRKALGALRHISEKGMSEFRTHLAQYAWIIRKFLNYTYDFDPLYGDSLVKQVRMEAESCIATVFKDTPSSIHTKAPSVSQSSPFYIYSPKEAYIDVGSPRFRDPQNKKVEPYWDLEQVNSCDAGPSHPDRICPVLSHDVVHYSPQVGTKRMEGFGNPYFHPRESHSSQADRTLSFSGSIATQGGSLVQGLSDAVLNISNLVPSSVKTQFRRVSERLAVTSASQTSHSNNTIDRVDAPISEKRGNPVDLSNRFRFCGTPGGPADSSPSWNLPPNTSTYRSDLSSTFSVVSPARCASRTSVLSTTTPLPSSLSNSVDKFQFLHSSQEEATLVSLANLIEDTCASPRFVDDLIHTFVLQAQKHPKAHQLGLLLLRKLFPEIQHNLVASCVLSTASTWKAKLRVLTLIEFIVAEGSKAHDSVRSSVTKDIVDVGAPLLLNLHSKAPKCRPLLEKIFRVVKITLPAGIQVMTGDSCIVDFLDGDSDGPQSHCPFTATINHTDYLSSDLLSVNGLSHSPATFLDTLGPQGKISKLKDEEASMNEKRSIECGVQGLSSFDLLDVEYPKESIKEITPKEENVHHCHGLFKGLMVESTPGFMVSSTTTESGDNLIGFDVDVGMEGKTSLPPFQNRTLYFRDTTYSSAEEELRNEKKNLE